MYYLNVIYPGYALEPWIVGIHQPLSPENLLPSSVEFALTATLHDANRIPLYGVGPRKP